MTRARFTQMLVAGGLASGAFALAVPAAAVAVAAPSSRAVVLTAANEISTFETAFPTEATAPKAVTGLVAGDDLVGIDTRPQNGALYGLGFNATAGTVRLYSISSRTAVATPVNPDAATGPVAVTGTSATTEFGFDFNPTVDRIRVVGSSGLDLRLNPNDGAPVDGDPLTAGVQPDGNINGATTGVDGAAYTNSKQSTTATTLYTLSGDDDALYIQNPPNAGTQVAVTGDGLKLDATTAGGFDIAPGIDVATSNTAAPAGSKGVAALNVDGDAILASIDLNTGAAAKLGTIGDGNTEVRGLALQQEEQAGGLPSVSLDVNGGAASIRRFNTATPGTGVTVPLTGVAANEAPVGIDWRPQTGQLFALGVDAAADTATLYRVDPQTGAATTIGTAGAITYVQADGVTKVDLPADGYDIDFNPTVDRVRIVTSSGLNARANQLTGGPVDGNNGKTDATEILAQVGTNPDGAQNGGDDVGTDVSGTAYTNAFGQSLMGGVTTQYGLSAGKDLLQIQNPPNVGTQTVPKPLGVDATAVRGFDIPAGIATTPANAPATGSGLAALTVGGTDGLYAINLSTGAATLKGALPTAPRSLALGDGPAPATDRTPPTPTPTPTPTPQAPFPVGPPTPNATPGTPSAMTSATSQAAKYRALVQKIVTKRKFGTTLRRGKSRTVSVSGQPVGTYTIRITRRTSNSSLARGKRALVGDGPGTIAVRVADTKAGKRYFRARKGKTVKVKLRVSYKAPGVKTATSTRNITLRIR